MPAAVVDSGQSNHKSQRPYNGHGHYLPFIAFIALTLLQSKELWPFFPYLIYIFKTLLVAGLLWHFRRFYTELSFKFHWTAPLAGLLVIYVWVNFDDYYTHLGHGSFDPTTVGNNGLCAFVVFFRLLGAVLVVPVMEELFFRSWVARWIINPNFTSVRLGAFSWTSLLVTTGLFAIGHFQWLAAIFAGFVFHGYVLWKKRLGDAIIAHAVANLALGIYVLKSQRWDFW